MAATEAQPRTRQEQPDDHNIRRALGRLEANRQTMMQRMDRMKAKLHRLPYVATGVGGGIIVALIGAILAILSRVTPQNQPLPPIGTKIL